MGMSFKQAAELIAFAAAVKAEHERRLSIPYPPASRPKEYPRQRTKNLGRSVAIAPTNLAQVIALGHIDVAYRERAFYGVILEVKFDRLGIGDTAADLDRLNPMRGRRVVRTPTTLLP
jgi:hypothetical protein